MFLLVLDSEDKEKTSNRLVFAKHSKLTSYMMLLCYEIISLILKTFDCSSDFDLLINRYGILRNYTTTKLCW